MPPSIRVKRSAYSTLRDSTNEGSPWTLAAVFNSPSTSPISEPSNPNGPRIQRSLPSMQAGQGPSGSPVISRPRADTTTSGRVHAHCTRRSERYSGVPALADQGSQTPHTLSPQTPHLVPHYAMMSMEGSEEADVFVRSAGEPGWVNSALSSPHSHNDEGGTGLKTDEDHHHDDVVEHLDVIDPQVATVSSLTNAANSILIPPMSWYSRKPVLILSSLSIPEGDQSQRERGGSQFDDDLDRHVDDVLKRPSKFKRTMKGVWSFLKTPMGVITAIYGFLVVFWGAAIVIFLAKIINFHNANTQGFWVEVSSQVVNGLFTVTGIGLIPARTLDTYRIVKIWQYKRRTKKLRAEAGLPQLFDVDDLPDPIYDPNYVHVLTEKEQQDLHRQQVKFRHSQTWYRPHGTQTHRAFPINTALLICCLNDGNSFFQIILCATMWGLNRFERPAWSTGTLIPCSFLCGIFAAVFIWRGGQKTKRVEEVEERLRAALNMPIPIGYDADTDANQTNVVQVGHSSHFAPEKKVRDAETEVDEYMTVPPSLSRRDRI